MNFIAGEPGRALGGDFFGIKLLEKKHGVLLEFHSEDIDLFSKEGEWEKHDDGGKDSENSSVKSFGDTCRDLCWIRIFGPYGGKDRDQTGYSTYEAEEGRSANKDFQINDAAFQSGDFGSGEGLKDLHIFRSG